MIQEQCMSTPVTIQGQQATAAKKPYLILEHNKCLDRGGKPAVNKASEILFDCVLENFAGSELDHLAGGNLDLFAGTGITAIT